MSNSNFRPSESDARQNATEQPNNFELSEFLMFEEWPNEEDAAYNENSVVPVQNPVYQANDQVLLGDSEDHKASFFIFLFSKCGLGSTILM